MPLPNNSPRQPSVCEFITGEELHDYLIDIHRLDLDKDTVIGIFSAEIDHLDHGDDMALANTATDLTIDFLLRSIGYDPIFLPKGETITPLPDRSQRLGMFVTGIMEAFGHMNGYSFALMPRIRGARN